MNVAVFSITLISAVFLLHVILWRVRLPKVHTRTLLFLFLGSLPVALVANTLLPTESAYRLNGFWQHVQVCLFHVSMSLAYIEFYTTIEEDSPSMALLLFLAEAGHAGRAEEEMYELITDQFVVGGRLQSLVNGGLVKIHDNVFRITHLGAAWARLFQIARRVYRLRLGG